MGSRKRLSAKSEGLVHIGLTVAMIPCEVFVRHLSRIVIHLCRYDTDNRSNVSLYVNHITVLFMCVSAL
jgi:hypothetical protein